jgi:hypothetical protein
VRGGRGPFTGQRRGIGFRTNSKRLAEREYSPGHPGREALLALPDEMDEASFDAALPILVRLLRMKSNVGGVARERCA